MKIALITDTHAGVRNDSLQFNEYFLRFYREIFFPYLNAHPEIRHVVHLGDVFDRRKYVNFTTLLSWRLNVFDVLKKTGCDVHIIVGNHDTYYKNTNEVNSVDQLLCQYGWHIHTQPTTVEIGDMPICLLPWICEGNYMQSMEEIQNTRAQVCMGHLEIRGFDLFPGHTNVDKGFAQNTFEKFDLVYSGHFHHKSTSGNVTYLGSPYPMTWSDWGDRRGFHVFDTETREIEFIENPLQIFHKIYYNDLNESYEGILNKDYSELSGMYVKVIVQKKSNPYWFDQFIESLQKATPCDISIVEGTFESSGEEEENCLDEAKDTLSILTEYVDALGLDAGVDELKQVLRDLYIEALNTNDNIQSN